MTDLRSLGVHVYISLVFHLSPENLRPGFESGLQTHPEDALDLRRKDHRIGSNTALRTHVSLVYDSGGGGGGGGGGVISTFMHLADAFIQSDLVHLG